MLMGKIIGILGGMGPMATINLFQRIVQSTKANSDQEHIHILIDNNTSIPDRTAYIMGKGENPLSQLIISAKRLENAGADFLIMPCNTAHYFYEDLRNEVKIQFVNMIDETAIYIKKKYPNIKKVGILGTEGTVKSGIYDKVFNKIGMNIIKPCSENQNSITNIIYGVKEGVMLIPIDGIYRAVEEMEAYGAEVFILGCTELSVVNDIHRLNGTYVDPLRVLCEKAIVYAGGKIRRT